MPHPVVFYDGDCGLCHGAVRFFALRERGDLRFAPLGGETFRRSIPPGANLPDSIVVLTETGAILTRTRAVIHLLRRLAWPYRVLAGLLAILPLSDPGYDAIARIRKHLFRKPSGACPLLPPHVRTRFDP